MSLRGARELFEEFHQFEPREVGEFHHRFEIPTRVKFIGEARTMFYASDKLNPETGRAEGMVRYYHPHEGGVGAYVTSVSARGRWCEVPKWVVRASALVLLGRCEGFEYETPAGEVVPVWVEEAVEWYCHPSGRAIMIVQDKEELLALFWGGDLGVEWRGVVG